MNLTTPITIVPFVGNEYARRLKKLGIKTVGDMLLHIPRKYLDFRLALKIKDLKPNETATVFGTITNVQNIYTKKGKLMQVATLFDGERKISILWFNQPYIARALPEGTNVSISGKVSFWLKKLVIFSPQYEIIKSRQDNVHTGRLIPIYSETEGVSSKWLRSRINYILKNEELLIEEFLEESIREKFDLVANPDAYKKAHQPKDPNDHLIGRKRLAFNELLEIQLSNNLKKIEWQKNTQSHVITFNQRDLETYFSKIPFELTISQIRSIQEISKDLKKVTPMNRLLEGDVGSGKTVVAAAGAFLTFASGFQTIFMAPTQILAQQHYHTLKDILGIFGARVALITGKKTTKEIGRDDVIVGTTALIYKKVSFDKVGLIVIDEQHRFGVRQRAYLAEKSTYNKKAPNILTMTATPIPRSIALTLYGDLDLSTLDELPKGRQKITTWIVPKNKRKGAYKWIAEKIKNEKAQVFVVCPLIEESEDDQLLLVKSATKEYRSLKKIFPKYRVDLLHGKLKEDKKSKVLDKFKKGKTDILVSTPVIEVGIDVPNATVIVIESAERFGLAQIHQLRGRVGRGDKKSYCLLFTQSKSEKIVTRLNALISAKNGRELAEIDLKMRGAGEIFGLKQHGLGEMKIATWQDIDLIKKSRELAIKTAEESDKYKSILEYFKSKQVIDN